MVSSGAVVGISLVALGLVLTPGPNMLYLVSRTLTQGRAAGLVSLLGVAAGFACYLVAAALGLTALFAVVPFLYDVIKLAGAAYLLFLAWQAVRSGGSSPFVASSSSSSSASGDSRRRLFTMGLVTNLLNPKIAVLYVSLLPNFIDPARGNVAGQGLVLGLVQIAIALTVNCVFVLTAGGISRWLSGRPGWLRAQRWIMGTVLGVLAVRLATDRGRPAVVS